MKRSATSSTVYSAKRVAVDPLAEACLEFLDTPAQEPEANLDNYLDLSSDMFTLDTTSTSYQEQDVATHATPYEPAKPIRPTTLKLESARPVRPATRPPGLNLSQLPQHHSHLGGNILAAVKNFKNRVQVHLRVYIERENGYHPTTHGITLSPMTWQCLTHALRSYTPLMKDPTTIINKELVLTAQEGDEGGYSYHLQKMYRRGDGSFQFCLPFITLEERHMDALKKSATDLSQSICHLTLLELLPSYVALEKMKTLKLEESTGNTADLREGLKGILTQHFSRNVERIFDCDGCKLASFGQLSHDCLTMPNEDRYTLYKTRAMCLYQPKALAVEFCQQHKTQLRSITPTFFKSLSMVEIITSIEEMYTAIDRQYL